MNLATITSYNKVNDELVIMQQSSSYWYAQIKTPRELGFKDNRIRFSTKCKIGEPSLEESYDKAVGFAKDKLSKYHILREEGHTPSFIKPKVKQIALKIIKVYEGRSLHKKTINGYINILKNQIIPLLGDIYIKNLGLNELIEFFENRTGGNSSTQITMVRKAIDDIYIYALRKKMINQADRPLWKDISRTTDKPNQRLTFRKTDLEDIENNIDDFINASTNRKCLVNRSLFKFYINFLKLTGARSGCETTKIKWKHIFESKFKNESRVTIFLEKGKMGERNKPREIHINKTTKDLLINLYLKKIQGIDAQRFLIQYACSGVPLDKFMEFKKINDDKYVFARSDGKTPDFCDIWEQFRAYLKGKLTDSKLTLYSFRHYFITHKLHQDIDPYKLAKYVGTSPDMINRYYDGTFSALASEFIREDLNQDNFRIFD